VNPQTSQVDDLHLVALPSAVNCAGLFVRFTLSEWSLPTMLDDLLRTVSHRVSAVVEVSDPKAPAFLTIRLRLWGDYLVAEVEDDVRGEVPNGRLPIGVSMTVSPMPRRGNLARSELQLPAGMTAQGVALPRRDRRRTVVAEQPEAERGLVEPEILERVFSSLSQWGRD
jgi:hypothetical protein